VDLRLSYEQTLEIPRIGGEQHRRRAVCYGRCGHQSVDAVV
jgi:hypothetical protein